MSALDTLADTAQAARERPAQEPHAHELSRRGPNPFAVAGVAFVVGVALAKWIDWRGRGRTRR